MGETDWYSSTDPQAMLAFLRGWDKLSERKTRLFAVACCRRIWHLLTDDRSRQAVEVAERYADGMAKQTELRFAFSCAADAYAFAVSSSTADAQAAAGAANVARPEADYYARYVMPQTEHPALLRDLFGPLPFRCQPLIDHSVFTWSGGTIKCVAEHAYWERSLPQGTLNNTRLAVLADALTDAGYTDPEILGHLRGPGPHWRGCHILDLAIR